jgi:hypothetical protein
MTEERKISVKGQLLPGVAGISMFMIYVTIKNVNAGFHESGSTKYSILAMWSLLAVGILGLLRMTKWGWAIVTAGCLLQSAAYFVFFHRTRAAGFLLPALFSLLFFLYLVRTEVRERLR